MTRCFSRLKGTHISFRDFPWRKRWATAIQITHKAQSYYMRYIRALRSWELRHHAPTCNVKWIIRGRGYILVTIQCDGFNVFRSRCRKDANSYVMTSIVIDPWLMVWVIYTTIRIQQLTDNSRSFINWI